MADFPDVCIAGTGPTRGNATLDVIATNFADKLVTETFFPLECADSTRQSDHLSITARAKLDSIHHFKTKIHQARKYTEEAAELFGRDLLAVDWAKAEGDNPSESAEKLDFLLQFLYNKHFPLRTIKSRSCDPPWITKRIKRKIRNRKREYARSGRSPRWRKKKEECERMIEEAKQAYMAKVKERIKQAGNTRSYFQAVNMLQSYDAPTRWMIQSMYPGLSDAQIAERAADFFNAISQEYVGLYKPVAELEPACASLCPEMFQIAAKLKNMKKPRSMVAGDIDPRLVTTFSDILAIPLHFLFNQVHEQLEWPR